MTAARVDAGVLRDIRAVSVIDDHAHPLPLGVEPTPDLDHPICPYDHPLPLRQRQINPEYIAAWRALWGYEHTDTEFAHLQELIGAKQATQAKQGDAYNLWVLDQLNVDSMIAVAYDPAPSLPAPRFRWCAFADWLMWPIHSDTLREPQLVANYVRQMTTACGRAGLQAVPSTLDGYLSAILEPELQRIKELGGVSIKFQTPYYRPIDFTVVREDIAAGLYARGQSQGPLTLADHRTLQDFLFHRIAMTAGAVGLPIQMHTGLGAKPHFDISGSNPLLMEAVFTSAPHTQFLLLHAGWPFDRAAISALAHENVYLDISCATIHLYPSALADIIRSGLEWFPEKIVYGSDAYSDRSLGMLSGEPVRANFLHGWEEKAWLMDRTAREALAIALTEMRGDGVIDAAGVSRLIEKVLRRNAIDLYGLADG